MNKRIWIFIIISALIGGMVGFFTAGRVAKHRIEKLRNMSHDQRSEKIHLAEKLDLSEDQKDKVFPILDKHLPVQRKVMRKNKQTMDSLRADMFKELQPLLSEEQLNRLEKMRRRGHKRRRH